LRLRWTRLALKDLGDAHDYLASRNIEAARVVAGRIKDAVRKVATYPLIGRPGIEPGTREWIVHRTRYLLVYEVDAKILSILRVWHMSQERVESGEDDAEDGAT